MEVYNIGGWTSWATLGQLFCKPSHFIAITRSCSYKIFISHPWMPLIRRLLHRVKAYTYIIECRTLLVKGLNKMPRGLKVSRMLFVNMIICQHR